jgi:hypothetical protein
MQPIQRGAGGTPGGLWEFFVGAAMIVIGSILFMQRLMVSSTISALWGTGGSGLALLILLVGIGILFFSGRAVIGWIMVGIGVLMIFVTVILNLVVYFVPTSLFQTVLMLGLVFGGIGLVARALQPHGTS